MRRSHNKERKTFIHVDIIDTADEGLAIGRCDDGRIIQVKGAVPGDVADVIALDKRKGMFITRPTHFHQYSNDRVDAFCSHFGLCGGCKWQHMDYAAQLRFKEKKVRDAFQRIGGMDPGLVQPIIGAPHQQYYRNKLEYTASDKKWLTEEEIQSGTSLDREGLGFHLPGAFDKILDIEHCYLQSDPSNAIRLFIKQLVKSQQWSFFNLREKKGFLRNLIIRNTRQGDVMLVIVLGEENEDAIQHLVKAMVSEFPQVKSIYTCINLKVNDTIHDLAVRHQFGDETIIEQLNHVRFHIGPKSFFQTNSEQATQLYTIARDLAGLNPEDNLYDLYCGVGSLGLFMADQCRQVVGIEQIAEAVEDARLNASLNRITNAQFVTGQVELLLDPGFVQQNGKPDIIITDPPRAGMHPDVIKHLKYAAAPRIVYISCNPATQARDLSMLQDQYEVKTSIPVDMFPHTHHIECVALLHHR